MSGEAKPVADLSFSELRQIITGQTEFVFKVNENVEMTFRELVQSEMSEIDKILSGDGGAPAMTTDYMQRMGILKLSRALKSIKVNGVEYPAITDVKKVEELLNGLGESIVSGLILAYEGEISTKFRKIEKKN